MVGFKAVDHTCTARPHDLSAEALGQRPFVKEASALITAVFTSLSFDERWTATAFIASAFNISLRYFGTSQSSLKVTPFNTGKQFKLVRCIEGCTFIAGLPLKYTSCLLRQEHIKRADFSWYSLWPLNTLSMIEISEWDCYINDSSVLCLLSYSLQDWQCGQ